MQDPEPFPEPQGLQRGRARPKLAQPERLEGVDDVEGASPLGRGANPGEVADTYPLSDRQGSVAGQRGANIPNARGGPEGMLDRENEDVKPTARRGATEGTNAEGNEAERGSGTLR